MSNPPEERALIVTCTSCGAEMRGDGRWLHEADCPQTRLWQTKKEQTREPWPNGEASNWMRGRSK